MESICPKSGVSHTHIKSSEPDSEFCRFCARGLRFPSPIIIDDSPPRAPISRDADIPVVSLLSSSPGDDLPTADSRDLPQAHPRDPPAAHFREPPRATSQVLPRTNLRDLPPAQKITVCLDPHFFWELLLIMYRY